jgi:hypothetical protein
MGIGSPGLKSLLRRVSGYQMYPTGGNLVIDEDGGLCADLQK